MRQKGKHSPALIKVKSSPIKEKGRKNNNDAGKDII